MADFRRRARFLAALVARADLADRLARAETALRETRARADQLERDLDAALLALARIQHRTPVTVREHDLWAQTSHPACDRCYAVEIATAAFAELEPGVAESVGGEE